MTKKELAFYTKLFENCHEHFFRIAYREVHSQLDAEDVVQNTFAVLASKIREARGKNDPEAWLIAVLHHQIQHCWRSQTRQKSREISLEENEEKLLDKLMYRDAESVELDLPPLTSREQRIADLRSQGYKYWEIAEIMGAKEDTCRVWGSRLKEKCIKWREEQKVK